MALHERFQRRVAKAPRKFRARFKYAINGHRVWGSRRSQVGCAMAPHSPPHSATAAPSAHVDASRAPQPAGGEGTKGIYGTMTTLSVVAIVAAMMRHGMVEGDLVCDVGAGLGG